MVKRPHDLASWVGVLAILALLVLVWDLFVASPTAGLRVPIVAALLVPLVVGLVVYGYRRHLHDCLAADRLEERLDERQALLDGIVQSALVAILAIDDEDRIILLNPAAAAMFGCSPEAVLGTSIDRFIPPRVRDNQRAGRSSALGPPMALRHNGDAFPVEMSMSPAIVSGRRFWIIVLRDDTARHQADAARRESEERFRLVADTAPVILWLSGPDKQLTYVNRSWLEFTGASAATELSGAWLERTHPDDVAHGRDVCEHASERRQPFTTESRVRRHDGEYRWILTSGVPRYLPDGSFAGYAGSAVDVTAQKTAREALADVSHRLMRAHESERTRIARELHDDIAQRTAVLTMELDALARALPLPVSDLRERIRALSDRALELGKDVQAISHSVHSFKLDYLGLVVASDRFCHELAEQHGIDIRFSHANVPRDVAADTALCIFRVLQEAVTNAVKHAGVSHVTAILHGAVDEIRLEVIDRGRGFDPEAAMQGAGLGLISMRERISLVKGELSILSRPQAGTTVRARVPLRQVSSLACA